MISLALKMLIGNRASCIGVIFGIFLATLLITQQSAIFLGLVARSYRFVTDIPSPDIWVTDPATESEDVIRRMPKGYVDVVRSTPNIEWAVPISQTVVSIANNTGIFKVAALYGIDEATLIGAPTQMVKGNIQDLRRDRGIIIDDHSAKDYLANVLPDGTKVPLKIGDELNINNRRAVIVGICKITQGFYPQSVIFSTYDQFLHFNPFMSNYVGFILAKSSPKANLKDVIKAINHYPKIRALTRGQFKKIIVKSFLETGILINFGLSVALGFIIGFSIAGQIFYIMTLENIAFYALVKAVGGNNKMILKMIMAQALLIGLIGFLLGTGATILWGYAVRNTTLAFLFPWQLLLFTSACVLIICAFTAGLSIRKVFGVDPKNLMGS